MKKTGKNIALAVIQVGNNPASTVYVGNKKKACAYVGIESFSYELPEETTQEELLALVEELNKKKEVNGILVQLPLPKHIDEDKVIKAIDPSKDVDGFHPGSFQFVNVFYFPFSVFSGFKAVANYHGERTILDVAFCHHPLAIVVKPSLDFREVDMEFGYLIRVLHFPFYSFG